jgi:hypothetical protein
MPQVWKTVKVPRMLYLPVVTGEGFNNSGMRLEPRVQLRDDDGNLTDDWTGDELELLPGSNQIRINGVDHRMLISCDKLNIDDNGFIQLNKPRPPAAFTSGGHGAASVGGMGVAIRKAKGKWDHDAAREWEGDAATSVEPFRFPRHDDPHGTKHPGYKTPRSRADDIQLVPTTGFGDAFDESDEDFIDAFANDFAAHMAKGDPDNEIRDVTLRDGTIAQARFDKKTGRQIGATFREYKDEGQQGQTLGYSGKAPTFDDAEYRRRLREQNQHATPAPTARERHEAEYKVAKTVHGPAEPPRAPAAPQQRAAPMVLATGWTTTGAPHLDQLIGAGRSDLSGWPLRTVCHLFGCSASTRSLIEATHSATFADSIVNAIGKVHMLKDHEMGPVYVHLEELNDKLRLALAEELPVIVELAKSKKVAVVIVTPDWGDQMPSLLKYLPVVRVSVEPHVPDPRFICAHIKKNDLNPNTTNQSVAFPAPDQRG